VTPVLIDTPVWRDYFAGHNPELGDRVEELIVQKLARISDAALQELLSQTADPATCERLAEALLGVRTRIEPTSAALLAGRIACRLRSEGLAPLLPLRALNASAAIAAHLPLLTTDNALYAVARFFPLKILCA